MTIEGFWKEVNEKIPLEQFRVSFPDYVYGHFNKKRQFLTVGVDIYQWIFEHTNFAESQSFTGFPESDKSISVIVAGIASKLRYLISLPLNFVIVFDGSIKLDKRRWDAERESTSIVFEQRYSEDLEKIRRGEHIMTDKCINALLELLTAWNISYLHAPGDAEIELARLNQAGIIDAVISNDADGFAYGANVILRNFSKFSNDKPSTATKGGIKRSSEYFVTPVTLAMLNQLSLDTDKVMFIACSQGDDYSKGMKGFGIKKSWALATNKNEDFDVVYELKSIYVSQNCDEYLKGILPYSFSKRLELLDEYKSKLSKHIADNGKSYFGRVHSSDVKLPYDHVIASHFYPHFARYLFRFESFETNLNEYSGRANNGCHLPLLPQPLSIRDTRGDIYRVYRGNSLKKSLGFTEFHGQVAVSFEPITYTPFHWFTSIDYETLLKWTKSSRTQKEGKDFLAESLAKCYVWRAIVNTQELGLKASDIYIKNQKSILIKSEAHDFEQAFYQIKYRPRQIFRNILYLDEPATDEASNAIEEEHAHVWLTSYLLFIDENGRRLVEKYNDEKTSKPNTPKSTPRRTPKKNKTFEQKTTLDLLSSSSKSPIKILARKPSLLDMSEASKSVGAKRTALEVDTLDILQSPQKKLKQCLGGDKKLKVNSVLLEPFQEDAEISRVLESTDYVGYSSFLEAEEDDVGKDVFFDSHANLPDIFVASSQRNQINSSRNNSFISPNEQCVFTHQFFANSDAGKRTSGLVPIRREFKKDNLTISRGISDLDEMTQLPGVPPDPVQNSNNVLEHQSDVERTSEQSLNDTFSSTDTMEKLFSKESQSEISNTKYLESGRPNPVTSVIQDASHEKARNEIVADISLDDTFSTVESLEQIFGVQCKSSKAFYSKKKPEDLGVRAKTSSTFHAHNSTPVNANDIEVESISDTDTLKEISSNQTKEPIVLRTENLGAPRFTLESVRHEESCSLPGNFDGGEILLAESTDDECMWVIPDKNKPTIFDEDLLEL